VLKHFLSFSKKERTCSKKETEKSSGERGEEGLKKLQKRGKAPIFIFLCGECF